MPPVTPQHDEDPQALGCISVPWQQLVAFHNPEQNSVKQSRDSNP